MRRATTARVQALCGCRETRKLIGFGGGDFKRECVRRAAARAGSRQVDQKLYLAVSIMLRGVP
jgi:hypothetical protein